MEYVPGSPPADFALGFVFDPADAGVTERIIRIRDELVAIQDELGERPVMPGRGMFEVVFELEPL